MTQEVEICFRQGARQTWFRQKQNVLANAYLEDFFRAIAWNDLSDKPE